MPDDNSDRQQKPSSWDAAIFLAILGTFSVGLFKALDLIAEWPNEPVSEEQLEVQLGFGE